MHIASQNHVQLHHKLYAIKVCNVFILSALALAILSACQPSSDASGTPSTPSNQVELIAQDLSPVTLGRLPQRFAFSGQIQAVQQTSIQSQVSATVTAVLLDVGQTVQKGQILLQLNNSDNQARLAQAQANLLAAQAQANQAERMMMRKKRLFDQGLIAQVEYEQSQVDFQNQRESVRAQQANVDIAIKAQQDGTIRSPINGVIAQRNVDVGQVVSVGQTLFEIVNPDQLELRGQIPLEAQNQLKLGQILQYQIQGNAQLFTARVSRIAPMANLSNRQIEFYAHPEQTLVSMPVGSYVQGELIAYSTAQGQLIALDRIRSMPREPYVWLVRNNRLLKVSIRVLAQDSTQNLALVEGLKSGDRISQVNFSQQDQHKTVRVTSP